jgi:uncharacterized protein (TIGR02246 family)
MPWPSHFGVLKPAQGEWEMHELQAIIKAADDAINREDVDAVMDFYTDDATLVIKPGLNATGKDQIRKAFIGIAEYFNHSLHVTQDKMVVVEGGDTALVMAKAFLEAKDQTGTAFSLEREATYVFRKGTGGRWLCTADNSYGTTLLRE